MEIYSQWHCTQNKISVFTDQTIQMSDIETQNDFELIQKKSKFIPTIQEFDRLDNLGYLQNIIENLFTVKGQHNESIYDDDSIVTLKDKTVLGHVVDIFGTFDGDVHYCCAKAINCPEKTWLELKNNVEQGLSVEVFAVQSLSTKMNKFSIKKQQQEEESDYCDSDYESIDEHEHEVVPELVEHEIDPKIDPNSNNYENVNDHKNNATASIISSLPPGLFQ